ncbi:MAG TPA: AraC family transcriptional regulator [Flavitalea sp.]|nr:AraC family transcriptional regulator [Flavitalea sp.]
MTQILNPEIPAILYSRYSRKKMEGELFIRQHVFDYIISGQSEVFFETKCSRFDAGDFRFAIRNRLSKFTKYPPDGGEYKSISICIDQKTLHEVKNELKITSILSRKFDNVFRLKPNRAFGNYFDSLMPYLENGAGISEHIVRIKVKEAVMVFLDANPELVHILFDFSEPGKIDLEAYMNKHYAFNGELEQFAYLTGRSLSTFKRDFKKIFNTTPTKWLIQKRLEDAHYLINEQGLKASEAYLESGFKDYSHFSIAFKKAYGTAPSFMHRRS